MRPKTGAFLFMARQNKTRVYSTQGYVLRHISGRDAMHLVEIGRCRVLDPEPKIGPRLNFPREIQFKVMQKEESKPSPTMITAGEMYAAVGQMGRSRTARLTERDKMTREIMGRRPEDFIECAEYKVQVWPQIGDTKAVRVGPRA